LDLQADKDIISINADHFMLLFLYSTAQLILSNWHLN
jgi:hypothetical protein